MASALIILALLLPLLLAGVIVFTLGVRGRWQRCEPNCAKCSQRLGLHEVTESGRCPECGHALNEPGGVSFFTRRRRPVMIVLGAFLVVAAWFVPALGMVPFRGTVSRATAALTQQPTSALILATASDDSVFEFQELDTRSAAGTLSAAEVLAIVDNLKAATDAQSQRRIFPAAESILIRARASGMLDNDTALELFDAWVPVESLVSLPRTLRQQTNVTLGSESLDLMPPITCSASVLSASLDGTPMKLNNFGQGEGDAINLERGGMLEIAAQPGKHELRLRVRRTIRFDRSSTVVPPIAGSVDPTASAATLVHEREVVIPIEVIADDAPSFIPLESPRSRREAVRRACIVRAAAIDRDSTTGRCHVRIDFQLDGVDGLQLAFDFFAVIDGDEIPLGWASARKNGGSSHSSHAVNVGTLHECPADIPDTIAVRLKPAPRRVESETRPGPIWGEAIDIEHVPVRSNLRNGVPTP